MRRYDKLIFVSNSDTAMGPMAEAILQSKYLLDELTIMSKGVVVLFPEPINPKAEAVLVSNGLSMKDHMSDPLTREDFEERTLILAVDENVKQKAQKEIVPEGEEIQALYEYVGEPCDVMNPYGGALSDYGRCFEQLEFLIKKLVVQLNEEELLR